MKQVAKVADWLDRRHWLLLATAVPFLIFPSPTRVWALLIVPGLWILASLAGRQPVPHTPLNGAILLLALMVLVSLYATYDLSTSLPKITGIMLGVAVFYAYVRVAHLSKGWELAFVTFLAIGAGIAGLGLLSTQWIAKVGLLTPIISRLPPRLTVPGAEEGLHPNEVAGALLWVIPPMMALLAVIFLQAKKLQSVFGRWRMVAITALITGVTVFVAGAFVLTQSRGGYIALLFSGLSMGVIALPTRKRGLFAGSLVIVAIVVGVTIFRTGAILFNPVAAIAPTDPALSLATLEGRMKLWQHAIQGIQDFPFTGMGLNTFRNIVHILYPIPFIRPDYDIAHAHNEFLQAALDLGIPGLIAFIALYIGALAMLRQTWNTADSSALTQDNKSWQAIVHSLYSTRMLVLGLGGGLFAHMLYGLTDAVALGAKPGLLFWMLLGLITGLFEQTQADRATGHERQQATISASEQDNMVLPQKIIPSRHLWGGSREHVWKFLLIALLFALCLRLSFLGSKSLWFDEALSLSVTKAGQAALWEGKSEPYHPPLFYWMLEYWIRLGESEFILRLPSAILGAASVPVMYLLGKDLIGKRASLSTAWLFALSPLLIWYSQEVRSYSLLIFIGLVATTAAVKLFLRPRLIWWLLFVESMIAALYTHYGAFVLIPAQLALLAILLAQKRSRWPTSLFWLVGWAAIIIAYLPWLRTPRLGHVFYLLATDRSTLILTVADDFNITPALIQWLMIGVAGLSLMAIAGLFLVYKLFQKTARSWLRLRKRNWLQASLSLLFVALLVASILPRAYTLKRQLIVLWPFGLLVLGWFWPWKKRYRKPLTLILLASLLASFVNVALIPKDQWRETVRFITEHSQPQDTVLLMPAYTTIAFEYYSQGRITKVKIQPSAVESQLQSLLNDHKRIWLVSHQADRATQKEIEGWLDQHTTQIETAHFYHLQVRLYQRK